MQSLDEETGANGHDHEHGDDEEGGENAGSEKERLEEMERRFSSVTPEPSPQFSAGFPSILKVAGVGCQQVGR